MRTINIGGQRFEEIRVSNDFYVDKTSFIKEWWENRAAVTLIARPRRFGKTLNMSMLECFFSQRYAGRADLFEGLFIWEHEEYRAIQGTYPVLFLSFADIKEKTFKEARISIVRTLQALFRQFREAADGSTVDESYIFTSITPDSPDADITKSLQQLSDYLYRKYKKKVLIFLDEYDTPLQEAFVSGYWDEMSGFIRSLFNSTFKTNPGMGRAVMTGVTHVSRESIFSDLNNLDVVTTTSEEYETAFGFTEEEVFTALDEYGLSDRKENVRAWYDGFTFGKRTDIYNPWSIINFLSKREFAPYWANTSSNSLISYELRTSDNKVKHQMESLMNGGTVTSVIDEQIIFSQLAESTEAIWSLLLASGYLRILQREFDGDVYHYTLVLTNHEVAVMFRSMIRGWFGRAADSYDEFTGALLKGDTELLNYYLGDLLLNVAGSFDTRKKAMPGHEAESFYHGLVLGLAATKRDYLVTSNRESGLGRYDVVMKPRDARPDKAGLPAVIMEFRVFDPKKEKTLEGTAKRALDQIKERKYDAALVAEGIPVGNILHYGFAFKGKEALVKMERRQSSVDD